MKQLLHKKYIAAFISLVGLSIVCCTYIYFHISNSPVNSSEIAKLEKQNNCTAGLKKISKTQPNPNNIDDSIELLKYKAGCLAMQNQYQATIDTLNVLKSYYQKKADADSMKLVNEEITDTKYKMANGYPGPTRSDKLDPAVDAQTNNEVNKVRSLP